MIEYIDSQYSNIPKEVFMSGYKDCGLKKVYYKEKDAKREAKEQTLRFSAKMYYYQCDYCHWWHLSKRDHRRKRYVIKSAGIVFYA